MCNKAYYDNCIMRNSYCDSNFTIGMAFPLSELNRSEDNPPMTLDHGARRVDPTTIPK